MKLVDILARELKGWPECARYILYDHANSCYADLGQGYSPLGIDCSDFDDDATDKSCTTVYRAQWQAAVDALKQENCAHLWVGWSDTEACELCNKTRKIVVEWNGEGLPPVGAVCEFQGDCAKCPSDPWHKELHDGVQCTVIAHFKSKSLDLVAFTFVKSDGNSELEQSLPGALRPIRTPEQIAAEEREQAVHAMGATVKQPPGSVTYGALYDLYDAGYRKLETVDN